MRTIVHVIELCEIVKHNTSQIFNLYKGIADLLKVSGDNLALHTINTLFKSKYEGKAEVSVSWDVIQCCREIHVSVVVNRNSFLAETPKPK